MARVHVFLSEGRFESFEAMRAFVTETYTEDGDGLDAPFMREIGFAAYEPMCIECHHRDHIVGLHELLRGASYGAQWIGATPGHLMGDVAICVFEPNEVRWPERSSLCYVGVFDYVAD